MAEIARHTEHEHPTREERDVNIRLITLSGFGLLVLLAGSLVIAGWLFRAFESESPTVPGRPSLDTEALPPPPRPRLQASPAQDWHTMLSDEDGRLHAYGWVDQEAGIAHIPIDHAIELMTTTGMPTWQDEQTPTSTPGQGVPSQ